MPFKRTDKYDQLAFRPFNQLYNTLNLFLRFIAFTFYRYHSIVKNRWYRPFVGIIVCSSFVYGTSVFVIAEVMDGCKHIVMVSKLTDRKLPLYYKVLAYEKFWYKMVQLDVL